MFAHNVSAESAATSTATTSTLEVEQEGQYKAQLVIGLLGQVYTTRC